MNSTIPLPGIPGPTTPLGVGLATLMREPSAAAQQRLLAAAHDAGFRHYDVAPSYGLGAAEGALGRFLRARPEGVTIATKVGIRVRANAGLLRTLQRPARALLRRFPAVRGRATQAVGGAVHVPPDFSIVACTRSLERSLASLGVEVIDLLLLHEPTVADLVDGVAVGWIGEQKRRGFVRSIGVAASAPAAAAIVAAHPGVFDVAQSASHVLAPAASTLRCTGIRAIITHSVLATPLAQLEARMATDRAWRDELSRLADTDITAPGEAARLLLAWAMAENPAGVVLVGSSSAAHLRAAPEAIGAYDGVRLERIADFLRSSLRG